MYINKIMNMSVLRDKKTGNIIVRNGVATPTWLAPVALRFFKVAGAKFFEQRVAQEVLARASLDALGFTPPLRNSRKRDERGEVIAEAQQWFLQAGQDYQDICDLAGMDSIALRNTVIAIFNARGVS
jgi:hypothetical protein